jgi:hypothetical protein
MTDVDDPTPLRVSVVTRIEVRDTAGRRGGRGERMAVGGRFRAGDVPHGVAAIPVDPAEAPRKKLVDEPIPLG